MGPLQLVGLIGSGGLLIWSVYKGITTSELWKDVTEIVFILKVEEITQKQRRALVDVVRTFPASRWGSLSRTAKTTIGQEQMVIDAYIVKCLSKKEAEKLETFLDEFNYVYTKQVNMKEPS